MWHDIGIGVGQRGCRHGVASSLALQLFAQGEAGLLIDPGQPDSLYQSVNAELKPVSSDGDPVGVAMDIRLWGGKPFAAVIAGQPDLATNGTFDSDSDWTKGVGWTISGGKAVATGVVGYASIRQDMGMTAGKLYLVNFDLEVGSGAMGVHADNADSVPVLTASGSYELVVQADGSDLCFRGNASFDGTVDNVTCKEIPGNHLVQATSSARPAYHTALGLHWLESDGVQQSMRAAFSISQPWERMSAFRQISRVPGRYLFDGASSTSGVIYQTTSTPTMRPYDGAGTDLSGFAAEGTDDYLLEVHDNTNSRFWVGSGPEQAQTTGSLSPNGITVFSNFADGSHGHFRIYFLAMKAGSFE